jgi:hypothetical protein
MERRAPATRHLWVMGDAYAHSANALFGPAGLTGSLRVAGQRPATSDQEKNLSPVFDSTPEVVTSGSWTD